MNTKIENSEKTNCFPREKNRMYKSHYDFELLGKNPNENVLATDSGSGFDRSEKTIGFTMFLV